MSILKYYCRGCEKTTNHGVIHQEHSLPNFNFSTLQCLACDRSAFSVQYLKSQDAPDYNSQRVTDVLPLSDKQVDDERGAEIYSQGWRPPFSIQ